MYDDNRRWLSNAPERCPAAHEEGPSFCDSPADAVKIRDKTGAEVTACVHHGSILLASLDGGLVLAGSVEGAAIETRKRANHRRAFEFGEEVR